MSTIFLWRTFIHTANTRCRTVNMIHCWLSNSWANWVFLYTNYIRILPYILTILIYLLYSYTYYTLFLSTYLSTYRASDKRKNLAAQKAAAQRRLLQPRAGLNDTDDKRKSLQDKRKEELVRININTLTQMHFYWVRSRELKRWLEIKILSLLLYWYFDEKEFKRELWGC